MMDLDKYLPFADQPTPKAQEGTWTLIAPDGRRFTGPSPIQCAGAESKTRIPPHVALGRIARGMQEPLAEALQSDEHETRTAHPPEGAQPEPVALPRIEPADTWQESVTNLLHTLRTRHAVNPLLYDTDGQAADTIDWLCKQLGECSGALETMGHPIAGAQTLPAAGWKLVPVEPTPEMVRAYRSKHVGGGFNEEAYKAMLAAAPGVPSDLGAESQGDLTERSGSEPPTAGTPSPSVDWRTEAIRWLRKRAADQACVNASYPLHVEAYEHWALLADQYMRAAEELEAEQAAAPYGE